MNEICFVFRDKPGESTRIQRAHGTFTLDTPHTDTGCCEPLFQSIILKNREDLQPETLLIHKFYKGPDIALGSATDQGIGQHEYATWLHWM